MFVQRLAERSSAFYASVVALTLLPIYLVSYQYRLYHPYGATGKTAPLTLSFTNFQETWLSVQTIPFEASAIAEYCGRTEWHPNLVFDLAEGAAEDVADVRGNMLDFLFYAIEAGASVVLPSIAGAPSRHNSSDIVADKSAFGTMFDQDWFFASMAEACPQMAVYTPEEDHKMADALPGVYIPSSRRMDMDLGRTKKAYLENLDAWLKEKPQFQPDQLTLVNVERTRWQVDTRNMPQRLRRNLGQVLRTATESRRLAAVAVQELASRFATHIDPRMVVPKNAFYGAQLHTLGSPASQPYSNFSAQADAYLAEAIKHKLKIIYVASDNASELALFKIRAATHPLPLIAVSKFDLLPADEIEALGKMTATQQALVDFEVMKRSSMFGGAVKSSFSYSVALARNQWLADQGKMNDPWFAVHQDLGVVYDDGISRILGRDEVLQQQIPRGMWP
ncbi:hypothetical protein LTR10_009288 [Elasticomyces elasticus]|nr:hypothetical protein LTR10_009288 [Elasticomyces elasticus]KAK4971613.1 hypothetical protein LTR42_007341 [Elasticomyces elasticus]